MQIVILAPPEPPGLTDEAEPPVADAVRDAVDHHLDGAEHVWVTNEKELVKHLHRAIDVLVIAAARVVERRIERIRALRPPPIVVVTRDSAATALALRRVSVEEIVEPETEAIARAIERQADMALIARTARVVEAHPRLSPETRRWMLLTLRASHPYTYVQTAATDAHHEHARAPDRGSPEKRARHPDLPERRERMETARGVSGRGA